MALPRRADFDRVYALPPRLEDWLPADHPARFIRAFVAALDLPALGFVDKDVVGAEAPYAVDLLLRVWLYGFFERFRSTRRLEWACHNVVALRWLTGDQPPDHNTLWRFFRDHKPALAALFRQSVRVAATMDLVGLVLHAVDGTKLQAACSTATAHHRAPLAAALARLDRAVDRTLAGVHDDPAPTDSGVRLPGAQAAAATDRAAVAAALAALDAAGTDHRHPGEPDARMMKGIGRSGHALGYNAQATADAAAGIVVACDVVAAANDADQLAPMVAAAHATLGAHADQTVADAGYATPAQLDALQEAGRATVVVAGLEPPAAAGPFDKAHFAYDADRDAYVCPRGDVLPLDRLTQKRGAAADVVAVYRCRVARCPERDLCTADRGGRTVTRGPYDDAVAAQRAAQRTPDAAAALRWRKAVIELVFARAKWLEAFVRFTARGLANVRAQWALLCTTLNLRVMYRAWAAGRALPAPA